MSVQIKSSTTSRFVEQSSKISVIALALMVIATIASVFFSQQLFNERVTVSPGERVELPPITLQRSLIGALRIDVKATIPTNRWVVYEIQLYDQQGERLATAIKEAWRESGIWREGGESGTWEEEDLLGGLDVQLGEKEEEELTIAVSVLEYGETGGNTITDQPVSFRVNVKNGVIDTRYLWVGFFGAIAMTILTLISVGTTGKVRIKETINDSDVGGRGIIGGENNLVKLTVKILSDETSPSSLAVNLWIKDGMGEQVYSEQTNINVNYRRDDGEIEDARGKLEQYFVFTRRGSYGFYVEVTPDQPIDRTTLIVKENAKTLSGNHPVKIITVDTN
ncbi:MAG: hypothetical protein ACLFM2_08490 [Halothece sp.]